MSTAQWINWGSRVASTILIATATAIQEPWKTAFQMMGAGLFGMTIPSPGQMANGKGPMNGHDK